MKKLPSIFYLKLLLKAMKMKRSRENTPHIEELFCDMYSRSDAWEMQKAAVTLPACISLPSARLTEACSLEREISVWEGLDCAVKYNQVTLQALWLTSGCYLWEKLWLCIVILYLCRLFPVLLKCYERKWERGRKERLCSLREEKRPERLPS